MSRNPEKDGNNEREQFYCAFQNGQCVRGVKFYVC